MTEAESAIRQFFDSYGDSYDRLDAVGAAAHHGTPSFIVHRGEVIHMNDDTKVDYFRSVFSENAAEGEHFWEIADLKIDQLAPNGAVVELHWIARRPNGSILWVSRPTYMVADAGTGWLIWGDIARSLD
jgi:hypothetical protein